MEFLYVEVKLFVGNDVISGNLKFNNFVKGWNVVKYDYVLMFDSNVLLFKDYFEWLIGCWMVGMGLVILLFVGIMFENFWVWFECVWFNIY